MWSFGASAPYYYSWVGRWACDLLTLHYGVGGVWGELGDGGNSQLESYEVLMRLEVGILALGASQGDLYK